MIISYAQNLEDVLLWRALGHIKNGFYIDVGANEPELNSVTKMFYDAGWSGINIEPITAFHREFAKQRTRDINLAVAAGATAGSVTLYDVPSVSGWGSMDAAVAAAHRAEGFAVTEQKVPVRTLTSICQEYVKGEIHFLKIDVEGFEGEVLRGMDFGTWRPWILVIEATIPNSRVTNHETWDALVTSSGYQFAYFDGLNRYYVAKEHKPLLESLSVQPNVFDAFISHHLDKAWAAKEQAEIAAIESNQKRIAISQWANELEQNLLAIQQSWSWRLTAPIRHAPKILAMFMPRDTKGIVLQWFRRFLQWVASNQTLSALIAAVFKRFPTLHTKVSRAVAQLLHPARPRSGNPVPEELREIPCSVRKVLADLKQADPPPPSH